MSRFHHHRYDDNNQEGDGSSSSYSRVRSFMWEHRYSILKDVVIVFFPIISVICSDVEDPVDGYGGCRILFFWLSTIVLDHVIEREDFTKHLGWNTVDVLIVVSAVWATLGYSRFVLSSKGLDSWALSPATTLFLVCRGHDLVLPLSFLSFLICFRMLRYLDVFPSILVPWRTFTRSSSEIFSYLIGFVLTLVAFASLYTINFGGEDEAFSGVGRSFRSLSPKLFDALPPRDAAAGARIASEVINIFFAFTVTFFITNLLLAIVLEHYTLGTSYDFRISP